MVDKDRKPSNSEYYTVSSEPFRINKNIRDLYKGIDEINKG
jgi:hypothetical protein